MKKPRTKRLRGDGDDYETVSLYALRIVGEDGWRLEESNKNHECFLTTLKRRGWNVTDLTVMAQYSLRIKGDVFKPSGSYVLTAYSTGWSFDEQGQCWRAPHEHALRYPGPTTPVDEIKATFGLPEAGWMDSILRAGDIVAEFSVGGAFDPIPNLLLWLERLADGDCDRLSMNSEGWYIDFHTVADGDRIRFIVEVGSGKRLPVMDILIDRMTLVAGLYCPLVTLWESDAFARAWSEWGYSSPDLDGLDDNIPPARMTPDPVRSARIDAVLRTAGWNW